MTATPERSCPYAHFTDKENKAQCLLKGTQMVHGKNSAPT